MLIELLTERAVSPRDQQLEILVSVSGGTAPRSPTCTERCLLDPTSNVDEDDTVMVKENSGMVEVEEAQKLAARLQMEIEIEDLRTKCLRLAETETRIRVRVRERVAAGESRQRLDCFKRNILFPIRVAFLSCSAALHLRRGGDDSDLDQFSELIREFTPNSKGFQAVALDLEHAVEWMAVMRNALMKAHIFPRMVSNAQKKRRSRGSA